MFAFVNRGRATVELERRKADPATYTAPLDMAFPGADMQGFLGDFYRNILFKKRDEMNAILEAHPRTVGKHYKTLVPSQVSNEDFWQRYYYRCSDLDRIQKELTEYDAQKRAAGGGFLSNVQSSMQNSMQNIVAKVNSKDEDPEDVIFASSEGEDDKEMPLEFELEKDADDAVKALVVDNKPAKLEIASPGELTSEAAAAPVKTLSGESTKEEAASKTDTKEEEAANAVSETEREKRRKRNAQKKARQKAKKAASRSNSPVPTRGRQDGTTDEAPVKEDVKTAEGEPKTETNKETSETLAEKRKKRNANKRAKQKAKKAASRSNSPQPPGSKTVLPSVSNTADAATNRSISTTSSPPKSAAEKVATQKTIESDKSLWNALGISASPPDSVTAKAPPQNTLYNALGISASPPESATAKAAPQNTLYNALGITASPPQSATEKAAPQNTLYNALGISSPPKSATAKAATQKPIESDKTSKTLWEALGIKEPVTKSTAEVVAHSKNKTVETTKKPEKKQVKTKPEPVAKEVAEQLQALNDQLEKEQKALEEKRRAQKQKEERARHQAVAKTKQMVPSMENVEDARFSESDSVVSEDKTVKTTNANTVKFEMRATGEASKRDESLRTIHTGLFVLLLSIILGALMMTDSMGNHLCSPLPPYKSLTEGAEIRGVAPWWVPEAYKADVFLRVCGPDRLQTALEWSPQEKKGPTLTVRAVDPAYKKPLFSQRVQQALLSGSSFEVTTQDKRSKQDKTEAIQAPWAKKAIQTTEK